MDVREFSAMIALKTAKIIPVRMKSLVFGRDLLGTSERLAQYNGLLGFAGLPGSCIGLKLISVLRVCYTTGQTHRQMSGDCRARLLSAPIAVALCFAAAAITVEAKPKRAVVLLDFSQSTVSSSAIPARSATTLSDEDVDAVSRVLASQFTGVPPPLIAPVTMPIGTIAPSHALPLGNPFVSYALSSRPITITPLVSNAAECAMPQYRPSVAFGREAEERRRILFPLVHRAACDAGLPVGLFDAMIMQESRYRPSIVSPKGAFGLAQLMPGTATELGVDRYRLFENLQGGARYLKRHVDRFGRYDLALAAYNAGPGRVERRWQVPAIAETRHYVRTIIGNWTGAPITSAASATPPISFRRAQLVFASAKAQSF